MSAPVDSPGHVELVVDCDPTWVRLVRGTAAHVAAEAGMALWDIEDVKLAVDESFAAVLSAQPATGIKVCFDVEPAVIGVRFQVEQATTAPRLEPLSAALLGALTEGVELSLRGCVASLSWRYLASAGR